MPNMPSRTTILFKRFLVANPGFVGTRTEYEKALRCFDSSEVARINASAKTPRQPHASVLYNGAFKENYSRSGYVVFRGKNEKGINLFQAQPERDWKQ